MLQLYVLYACLHMNAGKHGPKTGTTQCVQKQIFFGADDCKRELPKGGGLTAHTRHERTWLECKITPADSWIPAEANSGGTRVYEAQAGASDQSALAALLAPLTPEARATLQRQVDFKQAFQRSFQGPGRLSFFIVGTGSSVIAFAVTNLDDFQFAQMAADVSSSTDPMTTEKEVDFDTIAENAGLTLSHHTEKSTREMPPPGNIETGP